MSVFRRRATTIIAKTIRDSGLSQKNRDVAIRAFNTMLKEDNLMFDTKAFTSIANGTIERDRYVGYLTEGQDET